jgi:hypothetical protein
MAIHALFLPPDFREIITFEIKGLGHPEHVTRTVFDTKLTTLAPFFDHSYLAPGDLDRLQVKGNAPVFHSKSFLKTAINLTGNPVFCKPLTQHLFKSSGHCATIAKRLFPLILKGLSD